MTQSSQLMTSLCERCSRAVGQEILTCPDRPQGHCPFVKENLVPRKSRLLFAGVLLFGTLFSLWAKQAGDGLHTLIGLMSIGVGFFGTFRTNMLLYSPVSKLIWKRKALLGITLERTLICGGKPLHLDLSVSQPLLFPPSVTKLSELVADLKKWTLTQAIDLFRTALVGLLARGVIQIYPYQEFVARGWGEFKRGQDLYVFKATEETDSASLDGALERRMLLMLRSWATGMGEEALEWPAGLPVFELIRAVYDKDLSSPEQWVFDLVAQDAVARGWGWLEEWPRKRFEPDPTHEERLRSERGIVNELCSRFAHQQPVLSQVLTDQINWAVISRYPPPTYE